jgi:hypothetical protein
VEYATMSEMPRRWFQIHLSTAIILMFAAGGLLWANAKQHRGREYGTLDSEEATILIGMKLRGEKVVTTYSVMGWPFSFVEWYQNPIYPQFEHREYLKYGALALNLAACFAILLVIAIWIEWIIRHRHRKRQHQGN